MAAPSVAGGDPIEDCQTATYTLPNNQWRQISLPCATVGSQDIQFDKISSSLSGTTYGTNWAIYEYDLQNNNYRKVESSEYEPLSVGVGYWIIQNTGKSVTLALDSGVNGASYVYPSPPAPVKSQACPSSKRGCFEIPLATVSGRPGWNMVGLPVSYTTKLGNARIRTSTVDCSNGCDLSRAQSKNLVNSQVWTYNEPNYTVVKNPDGRLNAWSAYWMTTLGDAASKAPTLLVPAIEAPQEAITREKLIALIEAGADVTHVDTSQITDMSDLFAYAPSGFNQDISGWDVSNVTNMARMFGAREINHGQPDGGATAFNQDISGWDVSNVTNMYRMFYWVRSFNQDLSRWNVSKVVDHTLFAENANPGIVEPHW
jgi:surface protein